MADVTGKSDSFMDRTDRKSIGLEQILTDYIYALEDIDDYIPEKSGSQTPDLSPVLLRTLDSMIRTDMRILRRKVPAAYSLIPREHIQRFLKEQADSSFDRTFRFLEWFSELRNTNRQRRVERIARVNDLCANISRSENENSAARSFFSLNNQRVILLPREEDGVTDIILESAEREWGRAVFRFENCRNFDRKILPLPGYLYIFDGSMLPSGGFGITLLVDTNFGGEDYPSRLLSENGWQEFCFECSGISGRPVLYDYAGRMQRLGTPRAEIIERCSSLLTSKFELLGRDSLTDGEKEMLPAAELLRGSGGLLRDDGQDPESLCRQLIARALDNRYAMRRLCVLLERCSCDKLKRSLEAALERFDDDDFDAAVLRAEEFRGQFATGTADGSARPLLAALAELFTEMTSSLSGDPYRNAAELEIIDRVRNAVVPELERMGFKGSYPHYFRTGSRNTDYISFMVYTGGDKPQSGIISYFASIAAAQLSNEQNAALEKNGLTPEKTNALDCAPEETGLSRYGELAGPHDDGYIRMDMSIYNGGELILDGSGMLPLYIHAAERQFSHGSVPRWYRRLRRKSGAARGAHFRALAACSPLGVITAAALLLFFYFRGESGNLALLGRGQLVAAALSGGFAVNVLAAVIRNFFLSFRLWRY